MLGTIVTSYVSAFQKSLYDKINSYSAENPIKGRLLSIPVSLLDIQLGLIKYPFNLLEQIAFTIMNLVGVCFLEDFSIKHAIVSANSALNAICCFPAVVIMAPFKVLYQLHIGVLDPSTATSIDDITLRRELRWNLPVLV